MKKKLLSIACVAIVATAMFSGCGASSSSSSSTASTTAESSSEPSAANAEPVTITLWHSMSDETGVLMEKLVTDFNESIGKEKKITVESVFQGAYSDSTTKLRTILQNDQKDELPDVMQIDATGIVDYQGSKYKYTVDDALKTDTKYDMGQLVDVLVKNWNYNDVQLGMPFSSSTTVMYYNKSMLDTAGVAKAPTTFQEMIDAGKKLPKTTADGTAIAAYAQVPNTPSLANWIGQIKGKDADASYVVDNRNGRSGNATKLVCDTEGTLSTFLTEWKKMYDAGTLLNISDGLSDKFIAGQLAFFTASSSNLTTLLTKVGDKFEIGCANFPRVNADANYGATVSGSGMFMFNSGDSAKAAAAWEFVKYLASSEVQAEFSTGTGYSPACKAAYEAATYQTYVKQHPQLQVAIDQINQTSLDMLGVTIGPSWDFYMEIQNQVSAMLDKGTPVQDTVASMSTALNGLLEQYNKANS